MIYFKRYDIFIISVHRMIHNIITKSSRTDRYSRRRRKFSTRTGSTIRGLFFSSSSSSRTAKTRVSYGFTGLDGFARFTVEAFDIQFSPNAVQRRVEYLPTCTGMLRRCIGHLVPILEKPPLQIHTPLSPGPRTYMHSHPRHTLAFLLDDVPLVQPRVNNRQRSNFSRCYTTCVYIVLHTNFWTKRNEQGYEIKVLLVTGGYLQKFIVEKGDKF